jgi:hypothetical protein
MFLGLLVLTAFEITGKATWAIAAAGVIAPQ